MASTFHPDLALARLMPPFSFGPRTARLVRRLPADSTDPGPGVVVEELQVPGPYGSPPVGLRILRPRTPGRARPVVLWLHGGGYVIGSPEQDDRSNGALVRELGIVVVAPRYRLAPDVHAPAPLEDAYAALRGLRASAEYLGIDHDRVAVGGASAGGGLAAALALLAYDRGDIDLRFQLLIYPMLDDRTVTRAEADPRPLRGWTRRSNRFGWSSYLGREPGGTGVSPYAAPARRDDLSGLPPAWVGVGTLDLFYNEDLDYARRLDAAGVPTMLEVVPGAFHGFDAIMPGADVSSRFRQAQAEALRTGLDL